MKLCTKCNRALPLTMFTIRRASLDGLSLICRECASKYARTRYKRDASVRAKVKRKAKQWASENRQRRIEIVRKSNDKHRESKRAASRAYNAERRRANPEAARLEGRRRVHIRRGRRVGAGPMPPKSVMALLLAMARNKCVYCSAMAPKLTLDHVTPLRHGGSNDWSNFIPCCKSCNSSKNTSDVADWLFKRYGARGLADSFIFLKAARKAVRRLHASIFWRTAAAEFEVIYAYANS